MIVIDAAPGAALPEAMTVVIVEAASIAFAVPAPAVSLVTAPQPVTPLPLVPAFVEGLVGLNGAILPLIDLRRRLGLAAAAPAEGGELLVMVAADGDYALRVDHVLALATMEGDTVQVFDHQGQVFDRQGALPGNGFDALPGGVVAGEFPWRKRTVLLLDVDRVGLQDLTALGGSGAAVVGGEGLGVGVGSACAPLPPAEPQHIYVLARAGSGGFALPVEQVAEVVPAGTLTPVPGAPADVLGITQLRGRPLPVLAPAVLAGAGAAGAAGPGVLMVVNTAAGRFALRVDAVTGIRRFPLSRIHAGAEAGGAVDGRAGYLVDGEDRVIGLLDADRMTAAGSAAAWRALLPPVEANTVVAAAPVPVRQLLVFRIGAEWCAFDAADVLQLTAYRPLLPVPESAGDLAGLVEIGADVLPVLDLRTALGAPPVIDEFTAMIVVRDGADRWAVVTDRIDRLVAVPETALQTAEAPVHPMVAAVTQDRNRLISLLDLGPLLRRE